ncbi:hypothetical protein R50072_30170 [Simiduia litorea]|uniref:hypothetical protein n=1 Tax=Simiduia litorea TaxID=1435348 RepID=UPI0036F37566
MELYIFAAAAFCGGLYFVIRNVLLMRDEGKLIAYLQTSPKSKALVARYGMEETIRKSNNVFLPLGCIIGCSLLAVAVRNILIIVGAI